MSSAARVIHVAVAVLRDAAGRVLVAQRLPHQHLAGLWEFPGGKLEPGESLADGLRREIREELGVTVGRISPLMRVAHQYPGKTVLLDVWRVPKWQGEPHGAEGQPLRWLHPGDMDPREFPPADVPIISALQLPPCYPVSPDLCREEEIAAFVGNCRRIDARLVQVRLKSAPLLARRVVAVLRDALPHARVLLNSDTAGACAEAGEVAFADGVHLTSSALRAAARAGKRPKGFVAASCHDADELAQAFALALDCVTLSPVQATQSHPDATVLGWEKFTLLVEAAGLPVYALGGLSLQDLGVAEAHGAIGIAGISGFQ